MKDTVLDYTIGVGFPDAHFYGNDDQGIEFGAYQGSVNEAAAQDEALSCAQGNGFPNAALGGSSPGGLPTQLVFND